MAYLLNSALLAPLIIIQLCHNAQSHILFIVMLNVIILNVIMLKVIILTVVMLSVVMLSVVMLSVVMLSVVMLSVVRQAKWYKGEHESLPEIT
jgi:hypothetical protein